MAERLFEEEAEPDLKVEAETLALLGLSTMDLAPNMPDYTAEVTAMLHDAAAEVNPHDQWALAPAPKPSKKRKKKGQGKASFKRQVKASPPPMDVAAGAVAASAHDDEVAVVKDLSTFDNLQELRNALAGMGVPEEALPDKLGGKYSYTKTGREGAKIEVNVKQRHFRVNGVKHGCPVLQCSPNSAWSNFSTLQEGWEHAKARSGWEKP